MLEGTLITFAVTYEDLKSHHLDQEVFLERSVGFTLRNRIEDLLLDRNLGARTRNQASGDRRQLPRFTILKRGLHTLFFEHLPKLSCIQLKNVLLLITKMHACLLDLQVRRIRLGALLIERLRPAGVHSGALALLGLEVLLNLFELLLSNI